MDMAPGVADGGATQTETPHEAALQLIEALRNRKPEPAGKPAKGSKKKAEGKGSSAAAAQDCFVGLYRSL